MTLEHKCTPVTNTLAYNERELFLRKYQIIMTLEKQRILVKTL